MMFKVQWTVGGTFILEAADHDAAKLILDELASDPRKRAALLLNHLQSLRYEVATASREDLDASIEKNSFTQSKQTIKKKGCSC